MTPQEIDQTIRKATQNLAASFQQRGDYGFLRSSERKEFHSDGKLKTQSSWKIRKEERDGFFVTLPVERDGKPIPEAERAKNEEAVRKRLAELQAMTPEQRKELREKGRGEQSKEDEWIKELPDALLCLMAGEERIERRETVKFNCTPRPAYRPKNMMARVFQKLNAQMWIDKQDTEIARAEAQTFDYVNIGFGILGHINKGTHFRIERRKVAGSDVVAGAWLPVAEEAHFNVRVMLVKTMNQEIVTRYQDYVPRRNRSLVNAAPPSSGRAPVP